MLGIGTLLVMIILRLFVLVFQVVTQKFQKTVKSFISLSVFAVFTLLLSLNVYWWGFRWIPLFVFLLIGALKGIHHLFSKKTDEKPIRKGRMIMGFIGSALLLVICILPGILFPQFEEIQTSGDYEVATASYTYIDENRVETFDDSGDSRKLTVQYWYPEGMKEGEKLPLVIFSHGAFGYRNSNNSLYRELASNGYVVGSIDHSYHAFFAQHEDGTTTIVNTEFIQSAALLSGGGMDDETTFEVSHEWLTLRVDDMNFVLDTIIDTAEKQDSGMVYQMIDLSKIGLIGHSLSGATAAQICQSFFLFQSS